MTGAPLPGDPDSPSGIDTESETWLGRKERWQTYALRWWFPVLASSVVLSHMWFLGALATKLLSGNISMAITGSIPIMVTFVAGPIVSVTVIVVVALLGVFGSARRVQNLTGRQLGQVARLLGGNGDGS